MLGYMFRSYISVVPNLISLTYPLHCFHKLYLHISKMFIINIIAVISNLYVLTLNCDCWRMCVFPPLLIFFPRNPKCPGSYPCGYAYSRLGIIAIYESLSGLHWNNKEQVKSAYCVIHYMVIFHGSWRSRGSNFTKVRKIPGMKNIKKYSKKKYPVYK